MNIFRLLLSLEEFLYELLLAIYFVPKTFVKITLKPSWIHGYVSEEMEKDIKVRFDDYISPLLLFVVLVVFPFAYVEYSPFHVLSYVSTKITNFLDSSNEIRLISAAIYYLSIPLFMSIFIHRRGDIIVCKTKLKTTLYSLCYVFIPPYMLTLLCSYLTHNNVEHTDALSIIPVIWIIARAKRVIKDILNLSDKQSWGLAFKYYLLSILVFFAVLFVVFFIVLMGEQQND